MKGKLRICNYFRHCCGTRDAEVEVGRGRWGSGLYGGSWIGLMSRMG